MGAHQRIVKQILTKKNILISVAYLLFFELAAAAGLFFILSEHYGNFEEKKLAVLRKLPTKATEGKEGLTRNGIRALHPFFGFTYRPGEKGINSQGFNDKHEFPPERKKNHLMIGVFGGSVARDFAASSSTHAVFEEILVPAIHAAGYDYFSIYNFAIPGWRHPQQHLALSKFHRHLDLTIVLDGFNEVANSNWILEEGIPLDFPIPQVWTPLARGNSKKNLLRLGELARQSDRLNSLTNFFNLPVIGQLAIPHFVWRGISYFSVEKIRASKRKLGSGDSEDPFFSDRDFSPAEKKKFFQNYLQSYKNAMLDMDQLVRIKSKQIFYFLQPNQYLPDQKTFTREEEKVALANKYYKKSIPGKYAILEKIFAELKSKFVMAHSLADVFYDTKEMVYIDDCCHVNEKGNEIMATEIAETIAKAGILQAMPNDPVKSTIRGD